MNSIHVVITGPSGAGKSSVAEKILERIPGSVRLVTTTSRAPRAGETEGKDYYFCSREEFLSRRDRGEFLEWVENYGNLYGSGLRELQMLMATHPVVISVPDIRGARAMMERYPESVTVFVRPGDVKDLRTRLVRRQGDTAEEIERRIAAAEAIMAQAGDFDHVIVNHQDQLQAAVDEMAQIIKSLLTL